MLNKLLLGACLALPLLACTSASPTRDAASTPAVAATTTPAGCVSETASRIPAPPGSCTGFGRSYSQGDIRNTGQTDPASALRLLDSSVSPGMHH
jgi:hypothetical protein